MHSNRGGVLVMLIGCGRGAWRCMRIVYRVQERAAGSYAHSSDKAGMTWIEEVSGDKATAEPVRPISQFRFHIIQIVYVGYLIKADLCTFSHARHRCYTVSCPVAFPSPV